MNYKKIRYLTKGILTLCAITQMQTLQASWYLPETYEALGGNAVTDDYARAQEVLSEPIALSKTGGYRAVVRCGVGSAVWVGNSDSRSYFLTVAHHNTVDRCSINTYDGTTISPSSSSTLHTTDGDFAILEYGEVLDPALFGGEPTIVSDLDAQVAFKDEIISLVGYGILFIGDRSFVQTRSLSTSTIRQNVADPVPLRTRTGNPEVYQPTRPFAGIGSGGDSGGGAFVDVDGKNVLIGTDSAGNRRTFYDFTNIWEHKDYIESIVPEGVITWLSDYQARFTPDPSKKYYIDSPHHNLRIGATGEDENPFTTSTSTTGEQVEWVFVDRGNRSWHIQLAAGGSKPRLRSRNNGETDMQATSSSGGWTYYDFSPGALTGTFYATLPDHDESRSRLQVNNQGVVRFVPESSIGTWESLRFTEVTSSIVNIRKRNATGFALDGSNNSSNGQNVYLWSFNANNKNQQWEEIDRGGGYYSYQKVGTNFSLDGGRNGARNQNVYLWETNANNHNQQWRKEPVGDGAFKLIKRGVSFAIHGGGNGGSNGQNVDLWNSGSSSQNLQWFVE